jgi:hypothetical protein
VPLVSGGPMIGESDSQLALSRLLQLARSDLARELTEDADPDQLIVRVAMLAARLIPGATGCAIGLTAGGDAAAVLAETDPLGTTIIAADAAADSSPGADVMGRHGTLRIDDMRTEARWPHFCADMVAAGVLSLAVCDLPVTRRSRGILLVYSPAPGAFDDVAELMLPVFASRASIALGHRNSLHTLGKAIGNRQLIGQATGILMERYRITADDAFGRLVRASQTSQLKLHRVADLVVRTGQEPDEAS